MNGYPQTMVSNCFDDANSMPRFFFFSYFHLGSFFKSLHNSRCIMLNIMKLTRGREIKWNSRMWCAWYSHTWNESISSSSSRRRKKSLIVKLTGVCATSEQKKTFFSIYRQSAKVPSRSTQIEKNRERAKEDKSASKQKSQMRNAALCRIKSSCHKVCVLYSWLMDICHINPSTLSYSFRITK